MASENSRSGAKDVMATDKYGFDSYGLAIESKKGLRYNAVGFRTREAAEKNIKDEIKKYAGEDGLKAEIWGNLPNWAGSKIVKTFRFSRPGAKAKFAVEDRFYFGKERFASISVPPQTRTTGMHGTWKRIQVVAGGKKVWRLELHQNGVLRGFVEQHPQTRQFHAFDGRTDAQIGVGNESDMKRLVESL